MQNDNTDLIKTNLITIGGLVGKKIEGLHSLRSA
jgi:hypothetical protein